MATQTVNYNLKKPDNEDFYDIADQNNNMDIIDAELKEINTKVTMDSDNLTLLQETEPTNPTKNTLWFEIEGEVGFDMGGVMIGNAETSNTPPETDY